MVPRPSTLRLLLLSSSSLWSNNLPDSSLITNLMTQGSLGDSLCVVGKEVQNQKQTDWEIASLNGNLKVLSPFRIGHQPCKTVQWGIDLREGAGRDPTGVVVKLKGWGKGITDAHSLVKRDPLAQFARQM